MKQIFSLFLFFIFVTMVNGQGRETLGRQAPASWKKMELAPRVALGVQRAFYLEGGLALQRFIYDAQRGFVANTIYTCFEWTPGKKDSQSVYGVKAGAETVFNGGTGGIELKWLTNGDEEDFVITPKFGFGIGTVTLFYGYNISTNKYPFDRVRKHQFSLAINTNLLFYHSKYEKK